MNIYRNNLFKLIYDRCSRKEILLKSINKIFYCAVSNMNWNLVYYLLDNFELDFGYMNEYNGSHLSALLYCSDIDKNLIKIFFDRGAKIVEHVLINAEFDNLSFLMKEGYITSEIDFEYYLRKNHSSELVPKSIQEEDRMISFFEILLSEGTDLVDILSNFVKKYRSIKK